MADVISSSQLGVNTPFRKPKHWKAVFIFSVFAILFWLVELWYQYKVLLPGELGGSLVRGSALAGATLVGFALFSSAIFHFLNITSFKSLQNPAGYLLLVITGLAVLGEIILFFKVASKRRFRSLGSFVGIGLILLAGLLAYFSIRY